MRVPQVHSVDPVGHFIEKNKGLLLSAEVVIGDRITTLVLDCLGHARLKYVFALFPALYTAQVMSNAVLSLNRQLYRKQKSRLEKESGSRFIQKDRTRYQLGAPIGLERSNSDWINAWIQFVLYLPKFSEVISLSEKSFTPFVEFVEQYVWDQKEGKSLCLVDSSFLLRCLSIHRIQMKGDDFRAICRAFFLSMFPGSADALGLFLHDSIVFHPEWVVDEADIFSLFEQKNIKPSELILSVQRKGSQRSSLIKRQLSLGQGKYLYDLDALIEWRVDGARSCFVTYVRVDGAWYQCEDEKIRWISSRTLSVPISRGVLFHYKRVVL